MPALLAAGLSGLLLLASAAGEWVLAAAVFLVQALLLLAISGIVRVPGARAAAALALVVGGVSCVVVIRADTAPDWGAMAVVLGLAMLGAFAVELGRRDRDQLVESLSLTTTAVILAGLLVGWVALRTAPDGTVSLGIAAAAVGVAGLVEALPGSRALIRTLAVLVAAGAAALVGGLDVVADAAEPINVIAVGAFAALLAVVAFGVVDRIAEDVVEEALPGGVPAPRGGRRKRRRPGVGGTAEVLLRASLPLCLAAPVSYVVGRIMVG